MPLTGTWITTPAGTLVLTSTARHAPARHRHQPQRPGVSEKSPR